MDFGGNLPPGVPDTIYGDMIRIIETGGAHVVLDSSGKALEFGCRPGALLVMPNNYEAENLRRISFLRHNKSMFNRQLQSMYV